MPTDTKGRNRADWMLGQRRRQMSGFRADATAPDTSYRDGACETRDIHPMLA